jgi:thiamine pyrophosphokinase
MPAWVVVMARELGPEISFVGRGRKRALRVRMAVIALEGASAVDLSIACAHAARVDAGALLVAVDGGLATCRTIRRLPDLFVGDLDSTRKGPRGVPSRIYPTDKSFSDFSGALDEATRLGAGVVVVAGLLGGRLDHEWANLLEVGAAAPRFAGLVAPSARGWVAVTANGLRARVGSGRIVSVFALGGGARVSLRGTRWTLTRRRLAPGSLGLSNVAEGDVSLDVHEGVAGLVLPEPGR